MAMEARGEQMVAEAEKALKKWSLFGGTDKYEEAADKFQRAGNFFKSCKAWDQAAKAFENAAVNFVRCKSDADATACFTEAARSLVKAGRGRDATDMLETHALPRIVDSGRLSSAAKLENEIAEVFEAEDDKESAILHYEKAAEYFMAENSVSTAAKARARVAHLSAETEPPNFERASETFEQLGKDAMASPLLKFSAKGYFQQAIMCTLARSDVVAAQAQLERAKELDYTFGGSRECKLMEDVLAAFADGNLDAFTDAVYAYDQITKLDPWRTSVLLKIKTAMQKAHGEGPDLT